MTGPITIAIVGEDTAHAVLLCALVRASIEEVARAEGREWIVDNLAHDPEFRGDDDLTDVVEELRYTNSIRGIHGAVDPPRIDGHPVKLRGHLGDAPLAPEAQKWRALLTKVLAREPDAMALVAKDTDGHPATVAGLRQVVAFFERLDPARILVIAAPHQDAECWLVAGFEPVDDAREVAALNEIRQTLRFDPREHAERLTAHPNDAPTDAKRVLRRLLGLDPKGAPLDRAEMRTHHGRLLCDLDRLRRRGHESGLAMFLDEVRGRVVTRFVPGA